MPYVSQAQRGYMHVHHPEIAKRWDRETPKGEHLPKHVKRHRGETLVEAIKKSTRK